MNWKSLVITVSVVVGLVLGGLLYHSKQVSKYSITTDTLYGRVSGANGGSTISGPCINSIPPASHWNCTKNVTAKEYNDYVQPQLDKLRDQNMENAIEIWKVENGGPLSDTKAEEYCSASFDSENDANYKEEFTKCFFEATR